jgi:Zn ribbon nucleic-acid-binding protein
MGSVLDFIECPNCKHEASDDFYYKTGEEYIFCQNCGYHRSATIINRDKALNELTNSDWEIKENKHPYGAYRLKVYHSIGTQCGSLENEEQYNNFKTANEVDVEIEYCSVSRLVDGNIIVEIVIDNRDSTEFTIENNFN